MASSAIAILHDIIIQTVKGTAPGEWKLLVLDEGSRKLVDSVTKEDEILEENITNIEQIEHRRPTNKEMDAIYLLSPLPHIVDCLMADFERRRYRKSFVIWTSILPPEQTARLDKSSMAREQIAQFRVLNIDFFPRESHLITFRDPWSFPTLFHPACNNEIRKHMDSLAQKIVSVCVSLGEYPVIRYHRPRSPTHEASVLCTHLSRFVQDELDKYAQYHQDFPPQTSRPRGVLFITDRSMDLFAPLIHEFTYQAMVHDVLNLSDGDKVVYRDPSKQDEKGSGPKESEIVESDNIWVSSRHLHMKDLLTKLVSDFNKFRAENSQFDQETEDANATTMGGINHIKDMLAGLPQFQAGKEAYGLHIGMAQEAMNIFQNHRLVDVATVEQTLATGLDEEYKKPKSIADQLIRLLDDDGIGFPERLRLIIQYILYRDGVFSADIQKLLAHAQLPSQDGEVVHNLDLLGATVTRGLKDPRPVRALRQGMAQAPTPGVEENVLSRYKPILQSVLEDQVRGTLDQSSFPFAKPHLDAADGLMGADTMSQASLRSAKPTWARTKSAATGPKQRIIVFVAGGATYSESRACYEVAQSTSRDIYLTTSHMLSPNLFLRQVGDLSVDRRRLHLPVDRPKPKAPDHLFEREPPPMKAAPLKLPSNPAENVNKPPTAAMGAMNLNGQQPNGSASGYQLGPTGSQANEPVDPSRYGKREDEKKKKRHFFSSKK